MKSIIIAFALIAVVSCDVSHVVQGDGWYKDETGYHYTEPATKFDAPADIPEQYVEEPVVADEVITVEEPVYADAVAEVPTDYLPPLDYLPPNTNELREYLPPNPPRNDEFKRKRQIPARRQVRKVYRRVVRQNQKKRL